MHNPREELLASLRNSMVITTNLVFSERERIFKDPMTTLAAIDRVVHHGVVLDLTGVESYRAKATGVKADGVSRNSGIGRQFN